MNLTEKVSYVKGLMEGMDLDQNAKENKLMAAIIDLLDDMARSIADLEDANDEMTELMDIIDEDLGAVEEFVYGCEDDDEGCDCCDGCDDEELYEVVCPTCGETICIDEDMLDKGEIACPQCGEDLEFDLDGCDGCDGCDEE
ncbi:MAG TPA: hypothetical protein H9671_00265 [Firmicutes bacterium]|nr:hypothetical protein [Bacillota bacterium]